MMEIRWAQFCLAFLKNATHDQIIITLMQPTIKLLQLQNKPKLMLNQELRIENREQIKCLICEKVFNTKGTLKSHRSRSHPDAVASAKTAKVEQTKFECPVCGTRFKKNCHLLDHQRKTCKPKVPLPFTSEVSRDVSQSAEKSQVQVVPSQPTMEEEEEKSLDFLPSFETIPPEFSTKQEKFNSKFNKSLTEKRTAKDAELPFTDVLEQEISTCEASLKTQIIAKRLKIPIKTFVAPILVNDLFEPKKKAGGFGELAWTNAPSTAGTTTIEQQSSMAQVQPLDVVFATFGEYRLHMWELIQKKYDDAQRDGLFNEAVQEELTKLQAAFDRFKVFSVSRLFPALESIGYCYTFGHYKKPLAEEEDEEEMKKEEGQGKHAVLPYMVKVRDLAPPGLDSSEMDPNDMLPSDMALSNRVQLEKALRKYKRTLEYSCRMKQRLWKLAVPELGTLHKTLGKQLKLNCAKAKQSYLNVLLCFVEPSNKQRQLYLGFLMEPQLRDTFGDKLITATCQKDAIGDTRKWYKALCEAHDKLGLYLNILEDFSYQWEELLVLVDSNKYLIRASRSSINSLITFAFKCLMTHVCEEVQEYFDLRKEEIKQLAISFQAITGQRTSKYVRAKLARLAPENRTKWINQWQLILGTLKQHFANFHLLVDSSSSSSKEEVFVHLGTKQYLLDSCALTDGVKQQLGDSIGYHRNICANGAMSNKLVELLNMKEQAARLATSVVLTKTALVKRIAYNEDDGSASITEFIFDTAIPIGAATVVTTAATIVPPQMADEDELVFQELEDLQNELKKPELQKELVGDFEARWKKLTFKKSKSLGGGKRAVSAYQDSLEQYLPHWNYIQECNLDCGVAAFITCLRILGLHTLKIVDIYQTFIKHLDVCIVDLGAEFIRLGVEDFKIHSTSFKIADSYVGILMDESYSGYLKTLRASIDQLKETGNLIEGKTSLAFIRDYLDSCTGFVVVLVDVEKLPNNRRIARGDYQGHYIIAYKMDAEVVSILDPTWENEGKVHRVSLADFENARLAAGTDQSCIFIGHSSRR